MASRQVVVDWREAEPLPFQWRDAFEDSITSARDRWNIRGTHGADSMIDILFMAYPAASHASLMTDLHSFERVSEAPHLDIGGQLVLLACGQASPRISDQDVVKMSGSEAITSVASCTIRPMRMFQADSEVFMQTLQRRLTYLGQQGIAIETDNSAELTFLDTEHLDF